MSRLFTDYHFEYTVNKDLLCMPIATSVLKVVATKVDLMCEGIAPVVTIEFEKISVIDILNVTNWELIKRECEVIAVNYFKSIDNITLNIIDLANAN